jgi:tRNA A-37 threonylcarbamoyl transferase component Bud32
MEMIQGDLGINFLKDKPQQPRRYVIFHQLLMASLDLLSRGIVHNDLHLRNLIFSSTESVSFDGQMWPLIKLIDFGLTSGTQSFEDDMRGLHVMFSKVATIKTLGPPVAPKRADFLLVAD